MNWTNEQKSIIDKRNSNILVSAAAGSGKTAVLVERIINLVINENVDIDKFLVVTFTNQAARGMKQKIHKSLLKSLKEEKNNIKHIRNQINLLNKSHISTIHSFCIDVVRKNFHVIGVDPNFRIGDINEVNILLQDSIDEVLENYYGEKKDEFICFVESFTKNKGDLEISDIIKSTYRFILSFPYPIKWLEESVQMLNLKEEELGDSLWMKSVKNSIKILLDGGIEALKLAREISNESDGPTPYIEALQEDIYNIESFIHLLANDFYQFINSIYQTSHPKLKPLRKSKDIEYSEEKQSEVKALRDEYKKIIDKIKSLIPNKTIEEFTRDINYMYGSMLALYNLVADTDKIFKEKKLERSILDFNDVEHYALNILSVPEIGQVYMNKFEYIFIDEYQDSNSLQETLISKIKRKNNLFMVGDVKQSIYRFRLADPKLFIEKYKTYKKDNDNENDINVRIDLMKNFRSRKEILDGTNFIFNNIMSEEIGEVEYDEESFLNNGSLFNSGEDDYIELNIIDKNTEDDEDLDDEIKAMKSAEIEAKFAVEKIKELLQKETYVVDKKEFRKIEYKDIVILMRAVSSWSEIFEEVFENEGIPFYSDTGAGYFETIEIKIMVNFLKIIDNIRQDIPLLSVLRSPIGMFTTDELVKIRVFSPRLSYIDAVYAYKNKGNDALSNKLFIFIEKIENWKKRSRYTPLNDFIWQVLMETGYYYFCKVLPKGNIRQVNLRLLSDRAHEFEKTSMRGLFNFLRYIEKLNVSSGDFSPAKTLGENDSVVRLMSIHKSKGLEFPVVIVSGLNKKFNKQDVTNNILKHKDYGIAPKYINHKERIYRETFNRLALKNIVNIENLSEEMRVLYVAMTRAVDKLILVGTVNKIESKIKRWKKGPTRYNIYTGISFMDWICSSLYYHKDFSNIRNEYEDSDGIFNIHDLSSKWKINRVALSDLNTGNKENNNKEEKINEINKFKNSINSEYNQEIINRLNYKYCYQNSINIPSKLSVTDLKTLKNSDKDLFRYKIPSLREMPLFKEENVDFTKAEIGTIVHFVMQHLDIKQNLTFENILEQINEMINKKLLTKKQGDTVDVNKIERFFESDVGKRMKHSSDVKREVPFVIKKQAGEIISNLSRNDMILIQGIIDCYFYEEDEVVIIDYKTDDISQTGVDVVKMRYKPQILSYKEAVEKITNKKVKSCYLYLFDLNQAVEI